MPVERADPGRNRTGGADLLWMVCVKLGDLMLWCPGDVAAC